MTDLADGVVYSRSGLTYQAQLLDQRGLVSRAASPRGRTPGRRVDHRRRPRRPRRRVPRAHRTRAGAPLRVTVRGGHRVARPHPRTGRDATARGTSTLRCPAAPPVRLTPRPSVPDEPLGAPWARSSRTA
ncbi:hypothetical protein DEJ15_03560 [Curtobacterium sp. MCJR17_043]|nr:hypothetical protein [Curtobacterium sp. MCJR17_043]WIB37158.1 hypothetical protein DEJ15_03560 [Curtobacterium sp. MCJR17_043]